VNFFFLILSDSHATPATGAAFGAGCATSISFVSILQQPLFLQLLVNEMQFLCQDVCCDEHGGIFCLHQM
jgi:hypothetical protein